MRPDIKNEEIIEEFYEGLMKLPEVLTIVKYLIEDIRLILDVQTNCKARENILRYIF